MLDPCKIRPIWGLQRGSEVLKGLLTLSVKVTLFITFGAEVIILTELPQIRNDSDDTSPKND